MKKVIAAELVLMIIALSLAGCATDNSTVSQTTVATEGALQDNEQTTQVAESAEPQVTEDAKQTEDNKYEFEFEDVNGEVHKLSDYKGKPVYLKVWASWCTVCMAYLSDLNDFAGQDNGFAVLSVVSPSRYGEKSKEEFIEWYKSLGYENLTVLLDENGTIIKDFGVISFPSQILFDAEGVPVVAYSGELPKDHIIEKMKQITDGTFVLK